MKWGVAIALVAALSGCGNKKRQRRTGDAAPVEPIALPNVDGGGGKSDEVEPNDGEDVAMPLALGAQIHGRIDPADSDADFFRIDVAQAGALAIEVSAVDGTDLTLELHDSAGAVVAKSDRGGAKTKEGIPNWGVTPGRYIAVVRGKKPPAAKKPKRGAPAPAPTTTAPVLPYDITATVAPPAPNAEREPDDDRGTANDLIAGDPVTGYLGWTNDTDVWKLSLEAISAKNTLDLELSPVEGVVITAELSDGVGTVLATRKAPKGAGLVLRNLMPQLPPNAPPFHYLTIKGTPSNPESAYTLRVTAKNPEADGELEPNDTLDKPMAFPVDRTVVHAHWSPGDVDCFAIAPDPAARTVEAIIETPASADLSAELYVDGKLAGKSEAKGKGTVEKVSANVPANGKAIVKVRGTDAGGEGAYDVKLVEGAPSAP
ncbi:MAG TPA: hypothetical protein VFQ53_13615 [Kofleriaceae bacterium]|nr:hypothetical protein [Kofleriaceae bacterium]